jgi:prepilin-type N-terminal cleavage/methylation domain-containing protein
MRPQSPDGRRALRPKGATGRRGGFTLAETLLALAISAVLLAAIATAFNASVINYRDNQQMYDSLHSARQAMLRMTAQLRTGSTVDPDAASTECSFFTADGQDITYKYVADDHQLVLVTNADDAEYVLCDNVTAASFTKTATASGTDCTSVRISLTVEVAGRSQTLSSAAVIRRNLSS